MTYNRAMKIFLIIIVTFSEVLMWLDPSTILSDKIMASCMMIILTIMVFYPNIKKLLGKIIK